MSRVSICAVVVTYNRPQLLRRCIAALLDQELAPDRILVVDNASDQPASVVLADLTDERVRILRLGQNTGGAGGFHVGLRWSNQHGFDATWMMDDDGVPAPDCLAQLLRAHQETGVDLLNPLVINEAQHDQLSFGLAAPDGRPGGIDKVSEVLEAAGPDGLLRDTINPFNGTFVSRRAYEVLGDIKAECFIWGDEVEYTERAIARGISLGTVMAARHYHPRNVAQVVHAWPFANMRICPVDRSQYLYRNLGFIYANYRSPFHLSAKFLLYVLLLLFRSSIEETWKFARYYADGARDSYALKPSRHDLISKLAS